MKRRWKIVAVMGLAVGILATVLAFLFMSRPTVPPPGSILLPDGTVARLEAVTYGTNHLVGPRLAFLAQRFPMPVQILMRRIFGKRAVIRFSAVTDSPKLVLWLNRDIMARPFPTNSGYCECVLSDANGFLGGPPVRYGPTYPLEVKEFAVFPRRDTYFKLNIYHHDATGAVINCGSMNIPNPEYRRYPVWKPDALPATKRSGDLEVTLKKFHTGPGEFSDLGRPVTGAGHVIIFNANGMGEANVSACVLSLRSLADTNEIWRVTGMELSDATGNACSSRSLIGDGPEGLIVFKQPALWPDEAAWKLSLELKRTNGFKREELLNRVEFFVKPEIGPLRIEIPPQAERIQ